MSFTGTMHQLDSSLFKPAQMAKFHVTKQRKLGGKEVCASRELLRAGSGAELARRVADVFVCRAAAALEYGQLADAGVGAESYIVLVSYL